MKYLGIFLSFCLTMVSLSGCVTQRALLQLNALGHMSEASGVVGIVEGDYVGMPNASETVTIGGDVYEWDGVGANINVLTVPANADATYAALVTAINTNGTALVLADIPVNGRLRIRTAATRGGTVTVSGASIAFSETSANFVRLGANTNQSGRGSASRRRETCQRTVDALFAAAATARVCEFTWTPDHIVSVEVSTATGAPVYVTDLFTLTGNGVLWDSDGATHVGDTNLIRVVVEE